MAHGSICRHVMLVQIRNLGVVVDLGRVFVVFFGALRGVGSTSGRFMVLVIFDDHPGETTDRCQLVDKVAEHCEPRLLVLIRSVNHPSEIDIHVSDRLHKHMDRKIEISRPHGSAGFLIPPFVRRGALTVISGITGCGKTTMALEMARAVALGERFQNEPVTQGLVMYVSYEYPLHTLRQFGLLNHENLVSCGRMRCQADLIDAAKLAGQCGVGLLVLDTLDFLPPLDLAFTLSLLETMAATYNVAVVATITTVETIGIPHTEGI